MSDNPCLECGACCAFFRVSFYWAEAADDGIGVPTELTGQLAPYRAFMLGTNSDCPRCVALMGIIGKRVSCSIHSRRSSVCRDFLPSWQGGLPQEGCDRARAKYNLAPLQPHHWEPNNPIDMPRAA